ncbi:MAG: monovalent cation/H+ antiporter subunit D family protein [Hyphomicrobiaceae bacterium]
MTGLQPSELIVLAVLIPAIAALAIPIFHRSPNLRESVTLVAAVALWAIVLELTPTVMAGGRPEALNVEIVPGLGIAFKVEPLGMMFALVASTLWIVNSIYSIGYMRGHNEPRQSSFFVCFAVAISSTIGLAFAKNLFTLFIFYEVLTLSTYPLVAHKGNDEARNGARTYLMLLLGTSMMLLLPAIIITYGVSGTLEFTPGGVLDGKIAGASLALLLALFAFGIGKAALMPFHFWLPSAMVAPTPVSALLHAVAVVKAGVFTVLKVVVYIFGIDHLAASGQAEWLIYFASFCLITASLVALNQRNLKARLAYSTVSQLAYIVLGAALATTASVTGGAMHIVMHAVGKITLFFCAGAIYVAHHKTEIDELDGIGRLMPVTMFAFFIASLSIIGLPPFGGTWSKWFLALGALDAGYQFAVWVFMLSSLLNVAYLLPIVSRAFFRPLPGVAPGTKVRMAEAPIACVLPICITALGCLVLFFYADSVYEIASLIDLRSAESTDAAQAAVDIGGTVEGGPKDGRD